MNKVFLLGAAVERPEIRKSKRGLPFCELKLATNEKRRARDGVMERTVKWHKVMCFGQTAQQVAESVKPGTAVMVEGKLESSTLRQGNGSETSRVEIFASFVEFPEGRLRRRGARVAALTATQTRAHSAAGEVLDDDV